ncbi:hypothetical protein Gpo141_00002002 [Globisporangium polare]
MVSTRRPKYRRRSVPKTPDGCLSSPRSSTTSCTSSNSSSSGSGCSFAACAQQSPSFRCLEQIAIDMSVEEEKSVSGKGSKPTTRAIFYVMHVRHGKCGVAWSHRVPFDHYHTFHTQLMEMLKQGHVCRGDCPWLYSFLTSYFPKATSCPFKMFCPKFIAKRREALHQCFTTLHTFLLTRENQSCDVLRTSVLKAFTAFVYGELGPSHPLMSALKINEQLKDESIGAGSMAQVSSYSSIEDEGDASTISSAQSVSNESSVPACPLCRNRLDEDAGELVSYPIRPLPSKQPVPPSSSPSSLSSSSSSRYYATKLRCGHEFHEECILQWFNQELSCPACGRSELSPRRRSERASSASSTSGVEAFPE